MTNEPKVRSIGTVCTAAVTNTIYTCPTNYVAHMVLLFVVNHGANNKTVAVEWNDVSAGQSYHIIGGYTLTANGYLKLDGSYLVLNAGDTLTVRPESGATMDATVTIEEYYFPKQI